MLGMVEDGRQRKGPNALDFFIMSRDFFDPTPEEQVVVRRCRLI
jgi:hypothetical protein